MNACASTRRPTCFTLSRARRDIAESSVEHLDPSVGGDVVVDADGVVDVPLDRRLGIQGGPEGGQLSGELREVACHEPHWGFCLKASVTMPYTDGKTGIRRG